MFNDLFIRGLEIDWSKVERPLHVQSHGESFLSWMTHYCSPGIYLMDEPEAALSPQRQLSLLFWLVQMTENGA